MSRGRGRGRGRAVRLPAGRDHRRRAAPSGGRVRADGAARPTPASTVMLETGDTGRSLACPQDVLKIVDVKCPGSGEADKNDWTNLDALAPHDEVKFVIKDRADYEFARDVIARHELADRAGAVLMSPVHGVLEPRTLSEWMLADHLPARLQVQLHKYIWTPTTRGVLDIRRRPRCSRPALSGGLDSYTAAAIAKSRGVRAVRADHRATASGTSARSSRRARSRAALGVARHLELPIDLRAHRRFVADLRRERAARPRSLGDRHPVDLRAGAQHHLPVARARLGRSARGVATSSSASTRSITRAIRTAGPSSSARSSRWRRWRRAPASKARRFRVHTPLIALTKAEIIRRGLALGPRLRPDTQLLRSAPDGRPCGRCDSCALRAKGFAEAGVADPLLLR